LRAAKRAWDVVSRTSLPLSRDSSSPIAETGAAASGSAAILRYFASLAPTLEQQDLRTSPFDGAIETVVHRDAVGVCALVAPWNFPINLVVVKLAPALLAGCTVIVKPAPSTSLSIRLLVEAAVEAGIPPGVVNVLTGGAETGDRLVRHPGVDKVGFTGSTRVGRRIAATCGELLRPVTLELGGKSAAIVLPDADLDEMAEGLIRSCLRNTGQTCYISTRIIATADRYEEVVELVAATVSAARIGDPLSADTVFGPLASAAQRDIVLGHVRSAIDDGARIVMGGDAPPSERGSWVSPTVFADVDPGMRIAQEEVFGPVLAVMRADDVDDAIDIANATEFGLGGIVFGSDVERGLGVARRVDTGSVGLNFFASNPSAPLGGHRSSGVGVEYGPEGLAQYLIPQSVHRRRGPLGGTRGEGR
jgi:aldehyde dehydrogenase (NAD+)